MHKLAGMQDSEIILADLLIRDSPLFHKIRCAQNELSAFKANCGWSVRMKMFVSPEPTS